MCSCQSGVRCSSGGVAARGLDVLSWEVGVAGGRSAVWPGAIVPAVRMLPVRRLMSPSGVGFGRGKRVNLPVTGNVTPAPTCDRRVLTVLPVHRHGGVSGAECQDRPYTHY